MAYKPTPPEELCLACWHTSTTGTIFISDIPQHLQDEKLVNSCVAHRLIFLLVKDGKIVVCATSDGEAVACRVKRLMKCEVDDG